MWVCFSRRSGNMWDS